ncbi:MAG: AAA family ATPase [Magnetococcales bacterium]|nr:AAA family ATPase [Magnetococcales bacterium]
MFTRLTLSNFTVFEALDIEFSKGINVFVGANGTGKTHLLKLLYCLQDCYVPNRSPLAEKLGTVFRPRDNDFRRLCRRRRGRTATDITVETDKKNIHAHWHSGSGRLTQTPSSPFLDELPIYIPVKEVLSFAPGFISLYDKYEMAFDEVYYDILKLAYLPVRKGRPSEESGDILEKIRQLIGGQVVTEGDVFFLRNHENANLEMHLVAEGYRKLALLWQLIHNGSLLVETTLFWDEPEANLNPSLMQHVVNILIMLANRGVQVFLATHNFAFLKELDLQKQQTLVTYFAFDDSGQGVTAHSCSSYATITPNKIAEEYLRLYDQEMEQAFKGGH